MSSPALSYEQARQANIARNRAAIMAILGGSGLSHAEAAGIAFKPSVSPPSKPKVAPKRARPPVKQAPVASDEDGEAEGPRRSSRLRDAPMKFLDTVFDGVESEEEEEGREGSKRSKSTHAAPTVRPHKPPRENTFGEIEGVEVGRAWEFRIECSADGIHRPTVAGISGSTTDGCYSVCLSGGYEDDVDCGDAFTYTGEGGRDLKGTKSAPKNLRTAPQSCDQTLTKGNKALAVSVDTQKPVRVIRGYKLQSDFAPETGYRYDGLYKVVKYWSERGLSGFLVYKYLFQRISGQAPPPWTAAAVAAAAEE